MEEIRNAEALEKEILEDARKRAERVVRGRERALADLRATWAGKTEDALAQMAASHEQEISALERRNSAALPLEKKRAFLAFAEGNLTRGVHEYFSTLEQEKRDELLVGELRRAAPVLGSAKIRVRFTGMGREEAARIVERGLPQADSSIAEAEGTTQRGEARPGPAASIEVSTADSKAVVVASTARIERELLRRHRERLARALLEGNIAP